MSERLKLEIFTAPWFYEQNRCNLSLDMQYLLFPIAHPQFQITTLLNELDLHSF